jgi:hypothetical protein
MTTEWTRTREAPAHAHTGDTALKQGYRWFYMSFVAGHLLLVGAAIYGLSNGVQPWHPALFGSILIVIIASSMHLNRVCRRNPRSDET